MIYEKVRRKNLIRFMVYFILAIILLESVPLQTGNGQTLTGAAGLPTEYAVTFEETGLPTATPWTVRVIENNSANSSYNSNDSVIRFNETNGTYNYVVNSTTSYVTSDASGIINVSGASDAIAVDFERTAVSEYYQPFTQMNASQEKSLTLNSQPGPSALSFGVMNTTIRIQVYNGSRLFYENNITGEPTNFNTTMTTDGYDYVNFQSTGTVSVYATDIGSSSGYFAVDLWNYYISNYSASLITLPPHFQEVFGTGLQNPKIPTFVVANNTGMSFTLVAPYYREAVPFSIWIGEGYYNPVNDNYWWAQVGFNNWLSGMYDVSYAGWGVFSNYVNTTGGTDANFPLVPNETYTFTMETESNGTWGFFVNGLPINESGHSAYFKAPTDYASGEAYLGIEPLVGQRAGPLNSTDFFQGSIKIPNAESLRINGTWEKAANISFLYGVRDWEDGHGGTVAGMNIWGIQGNIQNKSIPPGEIVLDNGPFTPFEVPSGINYDVYPISGNFSFPWQNESERGSFVNVSEKSNGTILLTPLHRNTEISVLKYQNDSNYVYSDQDMLISKPVYIDNPALDFKAAIWAVPINSSTSSSNYNGIYQEIALEPIFSNASRATNLFSLGNVSTSYLGEINVPVYINDASSLANLQQVYSYDPSLIRFVSILNGTSSQYVKFSNLTLYKGIIEIQGRGSFTITSSHDLLFYLTFKPLVEEQFSTQLLLDSSTVNGYLVGQNASATLVAVAGWENIGPSGIKLPGDSLSYGGIISNVAFTPNNTNILYAASGQSYPFSGPIGYPGDTGFGGILKSDNGGKTWTTDNLGLTSTSITAIVVDPQDPNIAVAESRGGYGGDPVGGAIFKTINGGLSWQETYDMGGYQLQLVNGTLYATTFHSILKSINFGTTWTQVANFFSVVTASLISNNGQIIYVGLWTQVNTTDVVDQVMKSSNYGKSFVVETNFTESQFDGKVPSISQIVGSPSDLSTLWIIVSSPFPAREVGNPSLYRSYDGGGTWQLVNTSSIGLGTQQEPPGFITIDPANSSIIYLEGEGGLYQSIDGGGYFHHLITPSGANFIGRISILPSNDNVIFLGSDSGLFVSDDRGLTWSSICNASTDLLFDAAADNQRIFATAEGMNPFYSNDSGHMWTTTTKGYLGVVGVDPYNSSIVIIWTETHTTAGGPFFYVSSDGGSSFYLPSINFTAEINPSVNNIAFSQNEIFVPGGTGIFYSTDAGAVWSMIKGSPTNVSTIVDSPNAQSILYASNSSGLYKSSDYGVSWSKVSSIYFSSLAVDPLNSSILVGSAPYGSPYIYRPMISYDAGKSFISLGITSTEFELSSSDVYFYEASGKPILVFTSDQGLYTSNDLGKTWLNRSYNLPSTLINSFFASSNGTSYIATYGSGIFVDSSLFNFSLHTNSPYITGYLPLGSSLGINGRVINGTGYFSMEVSTGNVSIEWEGENLSFSALDGDIYFLNFSNMQVFLSLTERNLPSGTEWNVSANGRTYTLQGNGTVTLPPGTRGIYVFPVSTDYSIYYPSQDFYPINSSLVSSIVVPFTERVEATYSNFTASMQNIFWTTEIASNLGYVVYTGGGDSLLLNISTMSVKDIGSPFPNGQSYSVIPFSDGFVFGGSMNSTLPGLVYYNISSGSFINLSHFPIQWNGSYARITSVIDVNSTSFCFLGGSTNKVFFGIMENWKLISLSNYLPSTFSYSSGYVNTYSSAYISKLNAIILSNGTDIGLFYLINDTFLDISAMIPFQFNIQASTFTVSYAYMASDGNVVMITGVESTGKPFVGLFIPGSGFVDISNKFPPYLEFDTVHYSGRDFILAGTAVSGNSTSIQHIFIYNYTLDTVTEIPLKGLNSSSIIDSALQINNTIFYTTYNTKQLQYYSVLSSYYGRIDLSPTGSTILNLNTAADANIGNWTYYGKNLRINEFYGDYILTIVANGYANVSKSIHIKPFVTTVLNITLNKSYSVTFSESGLKNGTLWSVEFNNVTENSNTSIITFYVPNGSYAFNVSSVYAYAVAPASGEILVNGSDVNEKIIFAPTEYSIIFKEEGLPSGTTWYVNLSNGMTSGPITGNSYSLNLTNGTYAFTMTNLSSYYTTTSHITVTVDGKTLTETVQYYHWAYITGTISPSNATLMINGNHVSLSSSGLFNVSVANGTYHLVASENGHATYYSNFTLNPAGIKNLAIDLKTVSKPSSFPISYIAVIAVVVLVIAAVSAVAVLRTRKRK